MLGGLVTTKAERLCAYLLLEVLRLNRAREDDARERATLVAAIGTLREQLVAAEDLLERELTNAEALSELAARYEETLAEYERAWYDHEHPVKDPSSVILVDPVGVPKGVRPRGQVISLRRERTRAARRADEQSTRRNAVVGPPKPLPPSHVRPEERAAVRDAMTEETEG
jgi:hypothetical protein